MHTALQRNPRWNPKDSKAERDVHGADGRWLRRGAAERGSRPRQDRLLQRKGIKSLSIFGTVLRDGRNRGRRAIRT